MDEYQVSRCENLDHEEVERCLAIIRDGGAVSVSFAKLQRAGVVVLAKKDGEIVGVGTVKGARPDYARGIAEKSKFSFPSDTAELGYVAVDVAHRGKRLSHRIVAALIAPQGGRLFATTDDPAMKRTLATAGFVEKGRSWNGNRGELSLWLREF